jgi:predicted O-methyltransferase YrrM
MRFTTDWTEIHVPFWKQVLAELVDPVVLEIGSFEGQTTRWFVEELGASHVTTIDIFEAPQPLACFQESCADLIRRGVVRSLVGPSQYVMRELPANWYDLVYVDGSHLPWHVLPDCIHAFTCCNLGGILLFDDYDAVGPTVDAFVQCFRGFLTDLGEQRDEGIPHQIAFRKTQEAF